MSFQAMKSLGTSRPIKLTKVTQYSIRKLFPKSPQHGAQLSHDLAPVNPFKISSQQPYYTVFKWM